MPPHPVETGGETRVARPQARLPQRGPLPMDPLPMEPLPMALPRLMEPPSLRASAPLMAHLLKALPALLPPSLCRVRREPARARVMATGSRTVQSVDRAVSILEILARSGEGGVTDIARELGVHKSTAFRLVAALERRDLVEQVAGRGKYRLGTGILRLAGATTSRLDLVQESRGVARQLAQRTGETVNVAVLSDGAALYMDQVAGSSALQPHNWVGQRIPLHATSNGKVLLSMLESTEVRRQVPHLRSYTPHTITSFEDLMSELDDVRRRGFAIAIDELEIGLTAVAAPIRNSHGEPVASMSISGPTFRLDARRVPQMAEAVAAAADEVSSRLGWRGDRNT